MRERKCGTKIKDKDTLRKEKCEIKIKSDILIVKQALHGTREAAMDRYFKGSLVKLVSTFCNNQDWYNTHTMISRVRYSTH